MILDITKLAIGAVLGFLLNVLLQRLFQRRVRLEHELGSPAVFSEIPPQVTFQDLRVRNTGNAPATNLEVRLRNAVIADPGVAFKVRGDERYTKSISGDVVALSFERLLARETLEIAFKSTESLPEGTVVGVRSDEVLSTPAVRRTSVWVGIGTLVAAASVLAMLFVIGLQLAKNRPSESQVLPTGPKLSVLVAIENAEYARGDSVVVSCVVANPTGDTVRNLVLHLEVPGFDLPYDVAYHTVRFLEAGRSVIWKSGFRIGDDVPSGLQPLQVMASTSDPIGSARERATFRVK